MADCLTDHTLCKNFRNACQDNPSLPYPDQPQQEVLDAGDTVAEHQPETEELVVEEESLLLAEGGQGAIFYPPCKIRNIVFSARGINLFSRAEFTNFLFILPKL